MKTHSKLRIFSRAERFAGIALSAFYIAVFAGAFPSASAVFRGNIGPSLLRIVNFCSTGALLTVFTVLFLTFLSGRFYCSLFCPLGLLQELFFAFRWKRSEAPDLPYLRYATSGIVFALAFTSWSTGFLLLDPYSLFGRIFGALSISGGVLFCVFAILVFRMRRFFCTGICPVGTLLGLVSAHGIVRLEFTDSCVRCGKCVKVCPASCMDPVKGTIDNERCLRCLRCAEACAFSGVAFSGGKKKAAPDVSRRDFLKKSAVLLAGGAAGALLAKTALPVLQEKASGKKAVLPPGAGDASRFFSKCTGCQLCTANCPAKIIVPAPGGTGPVSLDLSKGACIDSCKKCSDVCPTGALLPMTLEEKKTWKIAEAYFDAKKCIVFQEGSVCGKCAKACPAGAIVLRKSGAPRPVKKDLCIGCGACANVCPAGALAIHTIEKQRRISAS